MNLAGNIPDAECALMNGAMSLPSPSCQSNEQVS